ncbi:TonB-dependent receptor plug domain-containing protein [Candidatus Poribacteria bacterium]|nr:TonB-dependent receptor plug domain-containing protein [Candidatus Poribacteria bacterium]
MFPTQRVRKSVFIYFILISFCLSTLASETDDVITLPPIQITAEKIEKKPKNSLDGSLINTLVGSGGDPLRVLNILPSVGVLNDFVGILSVRGGGPEDNLYYFDRLPLGYPYHLYGIVSTVNADVIQKVDVYPGGYGAEFGSDSQAVIDIYSRSRTDKKVGTNLNLNPVYSQAFVEGSIDKRGYYYLFGRRSNMEPLFELLPSLLETESDNVVQVPRFWSYQGKILYQINKTHRVEVNLFGSDDSAQFRFGADEVSESDLRGPFNSDNPFDSQGIHIYSNDEDKLRSVISLTRSFSRSELEYGEGYFYRNADSIYSLRVDLNYWIKNPITLLESGFVLSILPSNIISVGSRPLEEGDWDYNIRLKMDGEKIHTSISEQIHRFEGYSQLTKDLLSSSIVDIYSTFGLRGTYFNLIDTLSFQPRALLGLTVGPNMDGYTNLSIFPIDISLQYGNYSQNPQFYQLVLGDKIYPINPSLAKHYVVVVEKRLTNETRIEAAAYYKQLLDMISFDINDRSYRNQRIGSVRGIEFTLEHNIGDVLRAWLAYSYTISLRQDTPYEKEREYMFSTPHVLSLNLNYRLHTLDFGANWQYKSGVLYVPLEGRERYTNPFTKKQTWLPIYGDPLRTDPYHRLDLRIHWTFNRLDRFRAGFTFEVWNVYNRVNPLQVRYNSDFTDEFQIAQLPLVPFIALTFEY